MTGPYRGWDSIFTAAFTGQRVALGGNVDSN